MRIESIKVGKSVNIQSLNMGYIIDDSDTGVHNISRLFLSSTRIEYKKFDFNLKELSELDKFLRSNSQSNSIEKGEEIVLKVEGVDEDISFTALKELFESPDDNYYSIWKYSYDFKNNCGMVLKENVTLVNIGGLHARTSAKLSRLANCFESEIYIRYGDNFVSARSILDILSLGLPFKGCTIELNIVGADAKEAMSTIKELIDNKFGEEE